MRCYKPKDAAAVARLFTESVRATCTRDYSPKQIAAWAPEPPDVEQWRRRLDSLIAFLAEEDSKIVGFATFESDGHLDHLYVDNRFQRRGVASALWRRIEQEALARGIHRIFTEASVTALPFFESVGFRVTASGNIEHNEVSFKNYRMERSLDAAG